MKTSKAQNLFEGISQFLHAYIKNDKAKFSHGNYRNLICYTHKNIILGVENSK